MCCDTIICSSTTTTGTGVILIPNRTIKSLTNLSDYRLVLACNISAPTSNLPVFIQTAIGNIPVLCKYGNTLYANQLNKRVNYPISYGNQNTNYAKGQFVITSCSCLNRRSTPTTTAVTTTDSDTQVSSAKSNK